MSMKRTKKATGGGGRSAPAEGSLGFNPPPANMPKWEDIVSDKAEEAFVAYSPGRKFQREELIAHAKFGKGVVFSVDGQRIEVIFQEGVKRLAHGIS